MESIKEIILADTKKWLIDLSEESAAYLFGLISFVTFILINYLLAQNAVLELYWFTLILILYGFSLYVKKIVASVWSSTVGKAVISGIVFLGTTVSFSFADSLINNSFEVVSAPFTYTQSILAILIAPLVTSLFLGIFGVFFLPVSMVFFTVDKFTFSVKKLFTFWFEEKSSTNQIKGLPLIGRICALMSILSFCWAFNGNNTWYTNQLETIAKWYAFNIEMESYSHCYKDEKQKVRYVNKSIIVVGEKVADTYKFKTTKCNFK